MDIKSTDYIQSNIKDEFPFIDGNLPKTSSQFVELDRVKNSNFQAC